MVRCFLLICFVTLLSNTAYSAEGKSAYFGLSFGNYVKYGKIQAVHSGSPAQIYGLRKGMILDSIDGKSCRYTEDGKLDDAQFCRKVSRYNQFVKYTFRYGGRSGHGFIFPLLDQNVIQPKQKIGWVGITVAKSQFGIRVVKIEEKSLVSLEGLKEGDQLKEIIDISSGDKFIITSVLEFETLIANLGNRKVKIFFERFGKLSSISLFVTTKNIPNPFPLTEAIRTYEVSTALDILKEQIKSNSKINIVSSPLISNASAWEGTLRQNSSNENYYIRASLAIIKIDNPLIEAVVNNWAVQGDIKNKKRIEKARKELVQKFVNSENITFMLIGGGIRQSQGQPDMWSYNIPNIESAIKFKPYVGVLKKVTDTELCNAGHLNNRKGFSCLFRISQKDISDNHSFRVLIDGITFWQVGENKQWIQTKSKESQSFRFSTTEINLLALIEKMGDWNSVKRSYTHENLNKTGVGGKIAQEVAISLVTKVIVGFLLGII